MKKQLRILLVFVMVLAIMTGCSSPEAKYKKEVKDADLVSMIEDFMEEIDGYEVPENFDDIDFDVIMEEGTDSLDEFSETLDAFAKDVQGFNTSAKEILDALNEIKVNDDVKKEHDKVVEAFEEIIPYLDQISNIPAVFEDLFAAFGPLVTSITFVDTELAGVFNDISTEFAMSFTSAQNDLMSAFAILEEINFEDSEAFMNDLGAIDESVKALDDAIELVNALETANEADEAIVTGFVELFESLKTLLVAFSDNGEEFSSLLSLGDEDVLSQLDDYEEQIQEWIEYIEE